MFPRSTLLLGSPGAPAQQCALPCGPALGSLAKVLEFLPAHTMATVQHLAAFIEKEGDYKRMQLTVSRSLDRVRARSRKPEQSSERSLRLEIASMGISL